MVRHAEEITLQ